MNPLWHHNSSHIVYQYYRGDFDRIKEHIVTFQWNFLSTNPYDKLVEANWIEFKYMIESNERIYSTKTIEIM